MLANNSYRQRYFNVRNVCWLKGFFSFKINLQLILELRSSKIRCRIYNICIIILATQFYFFFFQINKDKSRRRKELKSVGHFLMACVTFNHFVPTPSTRKTKKHRIIFFYLTSLCIDSTIILTSSPNVAWKILGPSFLTMTIHSVSMGRKW